jgi:hypothetical protein
MLFDLRTFNLLNAAFYLLVFKFNAAFFVVKFKLNTAFYVMFIFCFLSFSRGDVWLG